MGNLANTLYYKFLLKHTTNKYALPLLAETPIYNILYDWPSHQGRFRGAVDFAVEIGTSVLAPLAGTVIECINQHETYGPSKEFAGYLNYLTLAHANGEFSQLAHLAKGSFEVKKGDYVHQGQTVAKTGLNGWMEEPYLEHLHFFVFRLLPDQNFIGLKIQFNQQPKVTI